MENLLKKHIEKIDTGFYLTKGLLALLFFVSISGVVTGISGLILSPTFFWELPEHYFMIITATAFILLGLALAGNRNTQRLKVVLSEIKSI